MATTKKGVDLSNWQAELTDARVLTEAGIEFAILKLSEGRSFADKGFAEKYRMCREAGIAVGAYVYSHSADAEGGRAEAEYALRQLGGRALELPIFLDIEADILNTGMNALMASALAFAQTVKNAGYKPGVYASAYPFRTVLDANELKANGISIWCAAYNGGNAPPMDCDFWQYTNTGRLTGYAGDLDLDVMYGEPDSAPAKPREAKRYPADMSVLCRGFYGTQVEALQLLLGIEPTGVFDGDTETAVRDFQRLCALADDGIAGPQTFSKLKETFS